MDVTAPGTLTAAALADAAARRRRDGGLRLAGGPAQRGGDGRRRCPPGNGPRCDQVRLVMSAGAPVPAALLREVAQVLPAAELHTPYGMTEVLPVADISLAEIEAAGPGNGVVRRPAAARGRGPAQPAGPRSVGPTAR